ncbi:disintegrin and metalloproteinase domain-containing protein 12-like [Lepisosteus oculatus]|uniref:disintegrin and metalloproteinase domain-containing protein 12-like n=1 Tax=Lepisosteus oculatus TaxID=7918 RepID=UPI0035F5258D
MNTRMVTEMLFAVTVLSTASGCRWPRRRRAGGSVETAEIVTEQSYRSEPEERFPERVRLAMFISGQNHTVHLFKTRDLLSEGYTEHYYERGDFVSERHDHTDHCCYTGWVEGARDSSVSLCSCQGFSGSLRLGEHSYTVTPETDGGPRHTLTGTRLKRRKRSRDPSPTPGTGPPRPDAGSDQKWGIELFLVADHEEFQRQHGDKRRTQWKLITLAHHLKEIYSQVGIDVWLVGTEVWTEGDKVTVDYSTTETLKNFLHWREEDLLPRVPHDNAQLISGRRFKGKVLGEGLLGTMCSSSQSGGLAQSPGVSAWELAEIVAHEMGHNLEMHHDNEPGRSCQCPSWSGKCLLSAFTGLGQSTVFSNCSISSLKRFLEKDKASCLKNRPVTFLETDDLTKVYRLPLLVWALSFLVLAAALLCSTLLVQKIRVYRSSSTAALLPEGGGAPLSPDPPTPTSASCRGH